MRLGDTVRVLQPSVYHALSREEMNERLAYTLIGRMHPDDETQYKIVVLDTQEKVDAYNNDNPTN